MVHRNRWAAAAAATALAAGGLTLVTSPQAQAADWNRCLSGPTDRQAVFQRASDVSGVPVTVLLGVSYNESRWDDHGSQVSSSGGYGVMHLTQDEAAAHARKVARAKGDGTPASITTGTLTAASKITGITRDRLRSDEVANVCGGAAVLASYQPDTTSTAPSAWSKAVGTYAGTADQQERLDFAKQVFATIRSGQARTTNDGQKMSLAATPDAQVAGAAVAPIASGDEVLDCPITLGCESLPAPYEQYGSTPSQYGNHDLANRPQDGLSIDYIVIHDTEGYYETALKLVSDPTYLAWHYTVRSSDGHVAQHTNPKNVGFHAGNWYVNIHSIGIEHEGFAATGATWYTESMYQASAKLVKFLSAKYGVPLDRAHIIGHDQVPGILTGNIPGMHWDPGPYWNWEHYMALLGKPIAPQHGKSNRKSHVVTIVPGFADNPQPVSNCDGAGTATPCPTQGTNFVYLHTAPSETAPLVNDLGLHQTGQPSTTEVSDIGPRATAGQMFDVVKRQDGWTAVWWLGQLAWFKDTNAAGKPVARPARGDVVTTKDSAEVPVYGRAYPEESAYAGTQVPYQTVTPLLYRIKPGQAYVLADRSLRTDYYYAKTYDSSLPDDHTVVVGKDRYYQIWFGHRIAYVRAADVRLSKG